MQTTLLGFYITLLIIAFLFAYGGYENTMRLFAYLDIQFRYAILRVRMYFMARKLRKQLNLPTLPELKELKELKKQESKNGK
jgi:hypothetical protein